MISEGGEAMAFPPFVFYAHLKKKFKPEGRLIFEFLFVFLLHLIDEKLETP